MVPPQIRLTVTKKNKAVIPESPLIRLGSSIRTRLPEQTWALAQQFMPRLGISRVTQITRMDRLGLPVFASIRPRGLTLRVHAGKGIAEIDAKVGALMEAIEFAVAEPKASAWQMQNLPVGALLKQLPEEIRFVDFAPLCGVAITAEDNVPCVECLELGSGKTAWLPAQLVFMPFFPDDGPNLFGSSTNGLASGNTVDEATVHGLLEVLERDAIAMNGPRDRSRWIAPQNFPEPFFSLCQTWQKTGVDISVRFLPNAFDLPCFQAILHESDSATVNLAGGYGLHVDPVIALSRAICEAAQSRLSHIHGGRDDITDFYKKYKDLEPALRKTQEAGLVARLNNEVLPFRLADLVHEHPEDNISQQLARLLTRLADRGFKHVYRHVFDAALPGLAVVKIIVPKCEQMDQNLPRVGPRLMQCIIKND
jgi:ribosomal protein S12 methylthiotransferase accessory factor